MKVYGMKRIGGWWRHQVVTCVVLVLLWGCSAPTGITFLPGQEKGAERVAPSEFASSDAQVENTNEAPGVVTERATESQQERQADGAAEPANWPERSVDEPEPAPDLPDVSLREKLPQDIVPETVAPLRAWIGEPCREDADCDYRGGLCLKDRAGFPGGHCTARCTRTCPDRAGKPVTFCIAERGGLGMCVAQCGQSPCRTGYVCETRERYREAKTRKQVCVPPTTSQPSSYRFLYIGDSQSSGTQFGLRMVSFLRAPQGLCPSAKSQRNQVHAYAKVSSASRHWSEPSGSSKSWLCRATKIYTNGTASSNTTGPKVCAGITSNKTPIFKKLIDTHKPNAFLIQLGGNSAGFAESYVKSRIIRMLDLMPTGSLCFWVTPSLSSRSRLPKRRDIEAWTQSTLQAYTRVRCTILTSIDEMAKQRTCPKFNVSDGLHMTTCGSTIWAQLIIKKICAAQRL